LNTTLFKVLRGVKGEKELAKVRKSVKSGHLKKWIKAMNCKSYGYIFTIFVVFATK
jgi:hypothetical protein